MHIFDSHAHYFDERYNDPTEGPGADEILKTILSAYGGNVSHIVNIGTNIDSSRTAVAQAARYEGMYAAVGIHPEDCQQIEHPEAQIAALRTLLGCDTPDPAAYRKQTKIVAIGEIGLDYYYEDIPRDIQKNAFRMQMALAKELDMPVIIHEREAHDDGMRIVKEFPTVKGVFHCYSGSAEMARQLVNMGWYIGFTGVLTFKNARKAVETAASIPLDRIVLETDCPFMAPEPYRGKRNDPGYLPKMAEKLAEIRGISLEEVVKITTENAKRLYRFSE